MMTLATTGLCQPSQVEGESAQTLEAGSPSKNNGQARCYGKQEPGLLGLSVKDVLARHEICEDRETEQLRANEKQN
jgi:hypothetical protein